MDPAIVSQQVRYGDETFQAVPELPLSKQSNLDGACTGCAFAHPDDKRCGPTQCTGVIFVRRPDDKTQAEMTVIREVPRAGIPTDAAARKAAPMQRGLFAYFPDALLAVAALSAAASKQHGHDEVFWERGKSNDHGDCLLRHQLQFDQLDTDDQLHAVKVAWRALAQLQCLLDGKP